MKRIIALILTVILLLGALSLPASAVTAVSGADAAEALAALGLLQGTGSGFELERSATRAEALTLLLRLLGREEAALAEGDACPFEDGGWAAPRITYAWKNGLVKGVSETRFGSDETVGARDWLTMLLRALGYSEEAGDFIWARSIAFADSIGLSHGEYTAAGAFLREDMVRLAYNALGMRLKGGEETLLNGLYQDGVVSGAAVRAARMSVALSETGVKPVYNSMEIYANCAPAIFYLEIYNTEEALEKDARNKTGSGFFVTADGLAVICYHELDSACALRVTTQNGRRYDVTGVLAFDALWDTAIIRVSKTDLDGETVSYFPYLELGDSDAVCAGEPVYLIGSPLGYADTITDGILSNCSRDLDDPDYLYFQHSAAAAQGSSGAPLLNRFGEVIGIHFANLMNGETMNLALPINVIAGVRLTGDGVPVSQVKEDIDAGKAKAVITADQTELALEYGEEVTVMISHNYPGVPSETGIFYDVEDPAVVSCTWGKFVSKRSIPLTITGVGNGETYITVSFMDEYDDEARSAVIHVTVTGEPEEPGESEELPDPGFSL